MWEILEKAIASNLGVIFGGLISIISGFFGYLLSNQLAKHQREYEIQMHKEERYLELLGKFEIFLVAFSMGVKELSGEKNPIKGEEMKRRTEGRIFDFAGAKPIVDLFGTSKMASLIEEINGAAQEMASELLDVEKEGKIITDPKELKSSAKFFSKKVELIDEIRKEIGQPAIE